MAWQCSVCDKIVEQGVRDCPNGCNPLDGLARILDTLNKAPILDTLNKPKGSKRCR